MKPSAHNQSKSRKRFTLFYLCFLLVPLSFSCKDSDSTEGQFNPNNPVEVTDIVPETGVMALPLVIHGKNFGNDKSKIKVFFDDVQAQVITAKNEHLYVLNPRQTGGEHTVKVIVEGKEGVLNGKFNYIVTSSVSTVAGTGEQGDEDGNALEATLAGPERIAIDDKGNIIITEYGGDYLRLLSLKESKVTTLLVDEGAYSTCFSPDYSTLYVAIEDNNIIANEFEPGSNWLRSITPNTVGMDYGSASVVTDRDGNVYYIGCMGEIVRKDIKTNSIVKIGKMSDQFETNVDFYAAYNPKDNYIYVSTISQDVIFRFEAKEHLVDEDFELYAGIIDQTGLNNSTRLESTFSNPRGMTFDSKGNLYIADTSNNVIRMITPEGEVSTFIGKPEGGNKDGAVEEALFKVPCDITATPDDIFYVADYNNYRIRCISIQ